MWIAVLLTQPASVHLFVFYLHLVERNVDVYRVGISFIGTNKRLASDDADM